MAKAAKRRAAFVVIAALMLALGAGLLGCSGSGQGKSQGQGTLKVGVRDDISGFGYYNATTQKYSGLEIDIATELASRLGYKDVEFTAVTPDNRKSTLQDGKVDCLIALYSDTESREKNFDFSPAYYTDKQVLMVENSSLIKSVDSLKGGTIGTLSGTDAAPQLTAALTQLGFTDGKAVFANADNSDVQFDNFHLLQFDTYQELSDALESGKIDAAYLDGSVAQAYMQDNRSLLDFQGAQQDYAVATQKDSELSQKVAEVIQAMLDDGTIAKYIDKWD